MSYKEAMKANIWKFHIFWFLSMFIIFLPFIFYYLQTLGFSLAEIAMLNSVTAVMIVITEVPSGYFADRYGRKTSLIIGVALHVISTLILYLSTDFYWIFISFLTLGMALSFASGADSALLYDSLLALKKQALYKKISGKAHFFGEIGVLISTLLGALLVVFGIRLLLLLNVFIFTVQLFVAFSFKEPKLKRRIEPLPFRKEAALFLDIVKRALYNKYLLGLFIYSFIVLGASNTIFVMAQPYFNATNLPLYSFGLIFAAFSIITGLVALKAHKIEEKLGVYWSLLLMPVFLIIAFLGAGMFFAWFGFMFFFFREAVRGFIHPVTGDYVNRLAVSHERATVLSVGSMFARIGLAVVSISFGFVSDNYGIRIGMLATGFVLLGFTVLVPLLLKHRMNRKNLNKNPA